MMGDDGEDIQGTGAVRVILERHGGAREGDPARWVRWWHGVPREGDHVEVVAKDGEATLMGMVSTVFWTDDGIIVRVRD